MRGPGGSWCSGPSRAAALWLSGPLARAGLNSVTQGCRRWVQAGILSSVPPLQGIWVFSARAKSLLQWHHRLCSAPAEGLAGSLYQALGQQPWGRRLGYKWLSSV